MGTHTGIVVRDLWKETGTKAGKRFLFRAWDPEGQTYASKRFLEKRDGSIWAKSKGARLRTGDDVTGKLLTLSVLTEFLADLRRRRRVERHCLDVERIIKSAIKAGLTDLRSSRLLAQAREWLRTLESSHPLYDARPLSPASRNRYLTVLRALVRFAVKNDRLPKDPLAALEREKSDRPLKAMFNLSELRSLVLRHDDPYHLRFCLMLYTGCRIGEAMHIKWENIDWDAKRIAIRLDGAYSLKQRKERVVPLLYELSLILAPIRKDKGWVIEDDDQRNRAVTYGWHFDRFLARAGMDPGDRTPHSTRHTWISLMLAVGENAPLVKAYAGHESLSTTEGYGLSQERFREAVRGWPRGEFELMTGASFSWSPKSVAVYPFLGIK